MAIGEQCGRRRTAARGNAPRRRTARRAPSPPTVLQPATPSSAFIALILLFFVVNPPPRFARHVSSFSPTATARAPTRGVAEVCDGQGWCASATTPLWASSPAAGGDGYSTTEESSSSDVGVHSNNNNNNGGGITGLLPDETFSRLSSISSTLRNLRSSLPQTLTVPLTSAKASQVYADGCTLLGPNGATEVLADGAEELVSLSEMLVGTVDVGRRAAELASSFTQQQRRRRRQRGTVADATDAPSSTSMASPTSSSSSNAKAGEASASAAADETGVVRCDLTLDPGLDSVLVSWSTTLPKSPLDALDARRDAKPAEIQGTSLLTLDSPSSSSGGGLVSEHQVLHVEIDGRSVDGVGEALAGLRRTVRTVRESSPLVEAALTSPLLTELTEIGENFLRSSAAAGKASAGRSTTSSSSSDQAREASDDDETTELAKLFIASLPVADKKNITAWQLAGLRDINMNIETTEADPSSSTRIDADAAAAAAAAAVGVDISSIPPPGSKAWSEYAETHHILSTFVRRTIPTLAGSRTSDSLPDGSSLRDLFTSDAVFSAFDGTKLLSGGGRIADLYRTASSLRGANTNIDDDDAWRMLDVSVDWRNRTVTVRWVSSAQVRVEGTDVFHFDSAGQVDRIRQAELIVGGSRIVDSGWVRAIVAAVERSRGGAGGEILTDVLQRVSRGRGGREKRRQATSAAEPLDPNGGGVTGQTGQTAKKMPPPLTEKAAASFYNIVRALHAELPFLADPSPCATPLPPAASFLSESVELRGLLGETLARGVADYAQAVSVSIGSLRAAMRTGRVRQVMGEPDIRIEVTPRGTIRVSVAIDLRIDPPPSPIDLSGVAPFDRLPNISGAGTGGAGPNLGIPLNLQLVSEYKVDRNGLIVEQRIVENRINGQKSPADLVSAWIKGGGSSMDQESGAGAGAAQQQGAVRAFLDAVNWARSAAGGGG